MENESARAPSATGATGPALGPRVLTILYRPLLRRASRRILEGRLLDPERPRRGRWTRRDVLDLLDDTWWRASVLLPTARLDRLPTIGNRHNVFLAVVTTAAYRSLLEQGVARSTAAELVGDIGWKVYSWMLAAAALPARIVTRDPRRRLEWTLRALLVFPFSAPGPPGYEVETWGDEEGFHTHWTHCPPQAFVRGLVESGEDRGELDAFRRSWCLYDWPGADMLAGDGARGHYERPHTLSQGDDVCDMCWRGRGARPTWRSREPSPSR